MDLLCLYLLQDLGQVKDRELSAVKEEMKQRTEKINILTQELHTVKASQVHVEKEKDTLQVKQLNSGLILSVVSSN